MDQDNNLSTKKFDFNTFFVTQSFDLEMTYFCCWQSQQKLLLFRCKLLNKTQKLRTTLVCLEGFRIF